MILICITFNGCINQKEVEVSVKNNNFKCDFCVTESDFSGEMTVNNGGELKMVFSGPDIINGVGITVVGETVIIDVKGISERYQRNTVPENSPATYIYDIFADIKSETATVKNDKLTVAGNSESGEYTAILNGTGFVEHLTLIDTGLDITFTNHITLN